jgi:hypothetical protein
MLRALLLSLLILCTVAATLPLADSLAKGPRAAAAQRHRRHRRHSRAWWRRHRRMLRRRHAAVVARRARLQAQTPAQVRPVPVAVPRANPAATAAEAHALLAPALTPLAVPNLSAQPAPNLPVLAVKDVATPAPPALVPAPAPPRKASAPAWPSAWHSLPANAAGELRFSVRSNDGRNTGAVAWTRVAAPQVAASANPQMRAKSLGGVSFTELRHKVIDKMMAEGGWVVNDMERTLGGRRTFVVVAESANAEGAHVSWVFYFTEFNGQVYALTTNSRADQAPALAADAEQFVTALNQRTGEAMTASRSQR